MKTIIPIALLACTCLTAIATPARAQDAQKPKYSAKVPEYILTPNEVKTRLGTLKFSDGVPDRGTSQKIYDNLDFFRGVDTFLKGIPATSIYALCEGFEQAGVKRNQGIGITEDLMDARSLFLTPNSTSVYVYTCADLKDGPVVLEVPPNVLGMVDDAYFRFVTDLGVTGPDGGKGGKYLLVPPGYKGNVPTDGYHVARTPTNSNLIAYRGYVRDGDIAAAVRGIKAGARMYPLSAAVNPPAQVFVKTSGKHLNTVHAKNIHIYEELNAVVQNEPADAFDPETVGLFATIGIKKGQPFAPDARMKAILTEAVAVGNATARSIVFDSRDQRTKFYPDRQWYTIFVGGRYDFTLDGERMLDARVLFHYYATLITPSMAAAQPGSGSAYAVAARDSQGRYFDGAKTYKVTLPAPIPAKDYWSFTAYSNQTRSMLETDQKLAGIDSNQPGIKTNPDGSTTIWFGPKPPAGQESNWVQTMPGKGWNTLIRLYGPLEPWFDKTWKPGDFELVD
jgi:hypothetical protein